MTDRIHYSIVKGKYKSHHVPVPITNQQYILYHANYSMVMFQKSSHLYFRQCCLLIGLVKSKALLLNAHFTEHTTKSLIKKTFCTAGCKALSSPWKIILCDIDAIFRVTLWPIRLLSVLVNCVISQTAMKPQWQLEPNSSRRIFSPSPHVRLHFISEKWYVHKQMAWFCLQDIQFSI